MVELVQKRENRIALWIMCYVGGQIQQDQNGLTHTGAGINCVANVPFRIDRQRHGDLVNGPWFALSNGPWQVWESWDDTAMLATAEDLVAKGEVMVPHDLVIAITKKLTGG